MSESSDQEPASTSSETSGGGARPRTVSLTPGSIVAGLPVELWVVIGLFVAPGVYFVVTALQALSPTFTLLGAGWLGFRLGLIVLFLLLVVVGLGVGLVAVAVLLRRADRVGRGLAYVAAGSVASGVLFGGNSSSGEILAMLAALVAIGVLWLAPAVREHFTGPNAPQRDQPTPIVVARVCLVVVVIGLALIGAAYFLLGTIEGRYIVIGLGLLAVAFLAHRFSHRLFQADRHARKVISVGAAVAALLLLFGVRDNGAFVLIALVIAVPFCLWIPADARAYFSDPPLNLTSGSGGGAS